MIEIGSLSEDRRGFLAVSSLAVLGTLTPLLTLQGQEAKTDLPTQTQVRESIQTLVRQRFGTKLDDKQIRTIVEDVMVDRTVAGILSRATLTNGDEPATVFLAE